MKRNLMLAVLFVGIVFAGHLRVTRASKHGPGPGAEAHHVGAFTALARSDQDLSQEERERAEIGIAMSPVYLDLVGRKNRLVIGLGSYLVNGPGSCNDCHTNPPYAPGGNPFRGQPRQINTENYLAGGTKFGPFTSRNLTPDPAEGNLPAGLTLAEFIHTLRTGEDHDQLHPQISPLLQVMPWPAYGQMSDRDLEAIYAYLSAIPHAEPKR